MKILFLTDNYPPETNAPAIRTSEHVKHWVDAGHSVTILTCAPNFPHGKVFAGHRNALFRREHVDGVQVVRVWSYIAPNTGFIRRTLDHASFMASATLQSLRLERPDVVIATSPQLFAAAAGWLVSLRMRRPFVFEIRDLWPESIIAVGALRKGLALRALERFAHFLYRRARLLVPVTQPFADRLVELGIPPERIEVVTNGIDPESISIQTDRSTVRSRFGIPESTFVAAYVGTVGMAHGLSTITAAAIATRDDHSIHYVVMGDGADRSKVENLIAEHGLTNITLIDRKPRPEALSVLAASDVSLVLLKNDPLFETVIPSKIFEAMALRRPIVLGVRGEVHRIVIEEANCGVAFEPEDANAMIEALRGLQSAPELRQDLGNRGYAAVNQHFTRSELARRMLRRIAATAKTA